MEYPLPIHALPIGNPWITHGPPWYAILVEELLSDQSRRLVSASFLLYHWHILSNGYPWIIHDSSMDFSWVPTDDQGVIHGYPWIVCGASIENLGIIQGLAWCAIWFEELLSDQSQQRSSTNLCSCTSMVRQTMFFGVQGKPASPPGPSRCMWDALAHPHSPSFVVGLPCCCKVFWSKVTE